jgi:hypothetical protein
VPVLQALAIAALLAPAPAGAADAFCADLRLVVASAREAEPFGSVTHHENWARFALLELCRPNRYEPVDRVACSWRLSPDAPDLEALVGSALRCLPGAIRDNEPLDPGSARLRLADLSIYLERDEGLVDTAALVVIVGEE